MGYGTIELKSSFAPLEEGFLWAKERALSYIHEGDPVGLWYDAALPNRSAFCMRDVAHQSNGAFFLGLERFTKNMLMKFAENISERRDFCTFWEINSDNLPAPVDYISDDDFWYNLPANFDLIDCCFRQYQWTGDRDYLEHPVFEKFYSLSLNEFVDLWNLYAGEIPGKRGDVYRRGIPSYLESRIGPDGIAIGSDLIAAMFGAYVAFSGMQTVLGNDRLASQMEEKARILKTHFERNWWSERDRLYFTGILRNGEKLIAEKSGHSICSDNLSPLPLYFNLVSKGERRRDCLDLLRRCKDYNVETFSHLPEVFYMHNRPSEAFDFLMKLMSPDLKRREYPEVSFSAVGSVMTGLMGFRAKGQKREISISPSLPDCVEWIELTHIPVFDGTFNMQVSADSLIIEQTSGAPVSLVRGMSRLSAVHAGGESGDFEPDSIIEMERNKKYILSKR